METSDAARPFTKDQIIAVLREHEAGVKAAALCRKHGISDATTYNWTAKYGGMAVSEATRLRTSVVGSAIAGWRPCSGVKARA